MNPVVTVVIPLYNRQDLIGETVESVLAQTLGEFELIVVDDCSTDAGLDVVSGYNDPRIIPLRNERNSGAGFSRNVAMDRARGDYVAFLDSDDLWLPTKLERQVALMSSVEDAHLSGTWGREFSVENGEQRLGTWWRAVPEPGMLKAYMLFTSPLPACSVMVRREFMDRQGLRFANWGGATAQDFDLWTRVSEFSNPRVVAEDLIRLREHPGRFTTEDPEAGFDDADKVRKRLLDRLGVPYSEEEYRLHCTLGKFVPVDFAGLGATEQWFRKVLQANETSRVYDGPSLLSVLRMLWFQACVRSRTSASERVKAWIGAPLLFSSRNPARISRMLAQVSRGETA